MNVALVGAGLPEVAEAPAVSVTDPSQTPSEPAQADGGAAPASASEQPATIAASAPIKSAYPPPAEMLTLEGPEGVRFDFNGGCRMTFAQSAHPWKARLSDIDSGNIIYQTEIVAGRINSSKRYYVRFRVELWQQDQLVFTHDYSARDREVLIQFPVGTLGDTMGWFPYAVKFKEKHGCRLTCGMSAKLIPLFRDAYPDITFVAPEEIKPESYYATYSMGLFFDDKDGLYQPCDFRHVGLHRTVAYILGVDPTEVAPRVTLADETRPIAEPYVCIAVQSTTQAKYWNNPYGWHEIVKFLKESGYRVICIDQKPTHGAGLVWNHIPNGAEDETGDRPLQERVRWLRHAEFFVGLASGLSWLAWAAGTRVVMISGFSHPTTEFSTPYRVINYHTCNSCWNDPGHRFDHHDFMWCPRHKNTPRQFECTRLITVDHVKSTIMSIPGFGAHTREPVAVSASAPQATPAKKNRDKS